MRRSAGPDPRSSGCRGCGRCCCTATCCSCRCNRSAHPRRRASGPTGHRQGRRARSSTSSGWRKCRRCSRQRAACRRRWSRGAGSRPSCSLCARSRPPDRGRPAAAVFCRAAAAARPPPHFGLARLFWRRSRRTRRRECRAAHTRRRWRSTSGRPGRGHSSG